MNRRSAVRILAAEGAGLLVPILPGWPAGKLPEDPPRDYTLRSDVVLVLLDVSVRDDRDRIVPDLAQENFRVYENGKLQTIRVFDPKDRPATVGILLDRSKSMIPKRPDLMTAADALVAESNRGDEMFILHFSEKVVPGLPPGVPFSGNIPQLRRALELPIREGRTALRDALAEGLRHLRLGRRDKKALALVTDGGDTASRVGRREALELVQRSVATIYAIGLYDPNDPDQNPGFLRRLANISGGEAYFPAAAQELPALCRRIAREIRARYTIGYTPPPRTGADPLRRVEVRATRPGRGKLRVLYRRTYRYDEIKDAQ